MSSTCAAERRVMEELPVVPGRHGPFRGGPAPDVITADATATGDPTPAVRDGIDTRHRYAEVSGDWAPDHFDLEEAHAAGGGSFRVADTVGCGADGRRLRDRLGFVQPSRPPAATSSPSPTADWNCAHDQAGNRRLSTSDGLHVLRDPAPRAALRAGRDRLGLWLYDHLYGPGIPSIPRSRRGPW